MKIDEHHPAYEAAAPKWAVMRHALGGEEAVKAQGPAYLPPTGGMTADGMGEGQPGRAAYRAYLTRAVFHDIVQPAVSAMVGIMHRKSPTITLPARLEGMLASATLHGETMEALLRRINTEQLSTGRVGLLLELPDGAGPLALPYVATYTAESVINWDTRPQEDGRAAYEFVVLDESGAARKGLSWQDRTKFRFLSTAAAMERLGVGAGSIPASGNQYVAGVVEDATELERASFVVPELSGRRLEIVPFVVAGGVDLDPDPDQPLLLPLARQALALYRLEADYRLALFMQAQDTLVITGGGRTADMPPYRVGAGAILELDLGADAKYIGVSGSGLSEMRQAVENDKQAAAELGGQIIDSASSSSAASGEALQIRVAARTATLASVARAGAEALARLLRLAAVWVGADPNEVKVEPNMDFGEQSFGSRQLLELMQAKNMGAPLARETVHAIMAANDLTSKTYEEEVDLIDAENPVAGAGAL